MNRNGIGNGKALGPVGTLLKMMVCAMVDHPELVTVIEIEGTQATVLELHIQGPGDPGKVIGRKGRTAEAIRDLLVNFGKGKRRYILEIVETSGGGLSSPIVDPDHVIERIDRPRRGVYTRRAGQNGAASLFG